MQFCGARIKEAREALGLTQADLASRVGVNASTVWRMEASKYSPRAETIGRLAVALDLSVSDLFDAEPAA